LTDGIADKIFHVNGDVEFLREIVSLELFSRIPFFKECVIVFFIFKENGQNSSLKLSLILVLRVNPMDDMHLCVMTTTINQIFSREMYVELHGMVYEFISINIDYVEMREESGRSKSVVYIFHFGVNCCFVPIDSEHGIG